MGRLEAQTLASRRGPCAPPLPPPESRPPADASRRRLPRRHPDRRRGRGESDGSRNLGRREGEEGGAEECRHRDAGESVRRRGSRRPQLASGLHGGAPGVHGAVAASPPDKKFWEAGGNCNLAIAASRLGLSCFTLGHVGDEIYGNFLLDVLWNENIRYVGMNQNIDDTASIAAYETLLCWVLVDPFQKHRFWRFQSYSNNTPISSHIESGAIDETIYRAKWTYYHQLRFKHLIPCESKSMLYFILPYITTLTSLVILSDTIAGKSSMVSSCKVLKLRLNQSCRVSNRDQEPNSGRTGID
ncbi:unnamed protein product [Musa acuminata subsp. malaccensis]|uniref:(wild Malaysian banana) hypothetical protein n=1 Tax=Musa acuminata subsp. malaccensis TaxID=214687 RepID=A0A804HQK2_MUSAM|nr:unnamed protein product [Musa acuminata subsp. malaccensis]